MLSMPPATITSFEPATSESCASIVAFIPEPHILDSVVQFTEFGSPAFNAACRAGACPCPAIRQLPNSSSCTSAGWMPARSTAALMATAPRSLADSDEKSPWKPPIGVRAAPTITIGSFCISTFLAHFPCSAGLRLAPRARHQFAAAVRTRSVHRRSALRAERAFERADARVARIGRKFCAAFLARGFEFQRHRHLVSLKSSRPMSIRRISDVPAPISYSFASRHSRPVGYSLI